MCYVLFQVRDASVHTALVTVCQSCANIRLCGNHAISGQASARVRAQRKLEIVAQLTSVATATSLIKASARVVQCNWPRAAAVVVANN